MFSHRSLLLNGLLCVLLIAGIPSYSGAQQDFDQVQIQTEKLAEGVYMLIGAGIPTLCGFGPHGENAHAPDECVEVAGLCRAVAMYAGLIGDYVSPASANAASITE